MTQQPIARPRHCRHCLGNCDGNCVIGDGQQCIHGWNGRHQRTFYWQLVLSRRWWHRVFWGPYHWDGRDF